MKRLVFAAAFVAVGAAAAGTTVYRLELIDDTPHIVGADGVRRPVVLVDPAEYEMLTGRVDLVWRKMNETEAGRRMIHGNYKTEIDAAAGSKIEKYDDGFIFTQKIPKKVQTAKSKRKATVGLKPYVEPQKPSGISDRQWEMRKRLLQSKKRKPKTVNVEHDATTGKDTVK